MQAFNSTLVAAILAGLLVTGCSTTSSGSSGTSGATGTSGTSGGGSSTGTGTTGGTTTATSGTTTGGTTSSEPYTGFVIFGEDIIGSAKVYSGQAGFYTTVSPITCSGGIMQGGCCYLSAGAALDAGATIPPDDISAGAVTLDDGSTTIATLDFSAGTDYSKVSSVTSSSFTWAAGDVLGVSAAGDASGVGSFSGTVVAPARLGAVHPAISSLSTISRTSDFALTWTGAGSGTVTLNVLASSGTSPDGIIVCNAPSAGGSLTVPATLLGNFTSGDTAIVLLTMANNTTITSSNATVGIAAETQVQGSATLE